MSYAFQGHIGIAPELAWGSAAAATDYIEAFDESLVDNFDRFETKNIIGGAYEPDDVAGVLRIGGAFTAPGHPVSIGYLLNGAFGQASVTEVLSGFLYQTTWVPRNTDITTMSPLPSYTFEVYRGATDASSDAQQFTGMVVSNLSIGFAPNQDARFNTTLIGKSSNRLAKTTPSFPGSPAFPFTFDTASVAIGGAGTAMVEALTFTLDNQLEGIPSLNLTSEIAKIRRSNFPMIGVSGTMDFATLEEYSKFRNQTEQALTVSVTKADSFQLVLSMPRVVWTSYPIAPGGRGRITVDFSGKCRYHTGSGHAIKVDLTTIQQSF